MEADGKTVRNLWHMDQYDPFFKSLSQRKPILDLTRRLVHGDPVLMAVETFNKPARVGSGVPPHQDNAYFSQTPPDVLTIFRSRSTQQRSRTARSTISKAATAAAFSPTAPQASPAIQWD